MIDVSDALDCFLQNITKRTITKTEDDNFQVTESVVESTVQGVVQPANPESLNVDIVDYSLQYLQIHTHSGNSFMIDDVVVWGGRPHKIINRLPYQHYGYFEYVAEEIK